MTDADLKQFFLSKLAVHREAVLPFIALKVDPDRESYYEAVFEPEPIVSEPDMVTSLVAIWSRLGLDPLAALEPDLRKLAEALRATDVQAQKVSNFIYAMY